LYFILKEVDFVAFFAFDVGGSKYPTESAEYISNNMRLLENTFSELKRSGVPFIHTTSQMSNMDHNPYGPLKRIAEFYTEYLGGVNIKVWNVYGPEHVSEKSHAIADFIHQARTTGVIQMCTTGEETRQFLHTADFAEAACHIMENYNQFKGQMIDISNYEWVSIRTVADLIANIFHARVIPGTVESTFQTKVNEPRPDFLRTGWKPKISLKEGIEGLCNV
jgi:nucleoside-diphosphate-sugar epimerase